jgi:DNA repair protein RadC
MGGDALTGPASVRDYLRLLLGDEDREVFTVVFLNAQNRVITCEPMFYGTLTQTAVYPREVARSALHHNAAAVILAHNHPSGTTEPSRADLSLTCGLMEVLRMFDVKVLDHFVVSGTGATSLMECGLLGMRDFPETQPMAARRKGRRKTKSVSE